MSAAEPGQIVVGPSIHAKLDAVATVKLTPLGSIRLKGKSEPVEAWVLIGASR